MMNKQIEEVGYRKPSGQPPLLSDEDIRAELKRYFTDEQMIMPEEIHDICCGVIAVVRKAQREADIKYYEGG